MINLIPNSLAKFARDCAIASTAIIVGKCYDKVWEASKTKYNEYKAAREAEGKPLVTNPFKNVAGLLTESKEPTNENN